jgi:hypothetical protein
MRGKEQAGTLALQSVALRVILAHLSLLTVIKPSRVSYRIYRNLSETYAHGDGEKT